jgi:hypothetical protein
MEEYARCRKLSELAAGTIFFKSGKDLCYYYFIKLLLLFFWMVSRQHKNKIHVHFTVRVENIMKNNTERSCRLHKSVACRVCVTFVTSFSNNDDDNNNENDANKKKEERCDRCKRMMMMLRSAQKEILLTVRKAAAEGTNSIN